MIATGAYVSIALGGALALPLAITSALVRLFESFFLLPSRRPIFTILRIIVLSHKLVSWSFISRCPKIFPSMHILVRNRTDVYTTWFVLFETVTPDERKEKDE